jgi:hypothetical protein
MSLEAIREVFLPLEADAAKVELKINEKKTQYMIASGNWTILDAGQTVVLGDKNFEVFNKFLYLAALVTPKNDSEIGDTVKNPNCKYELLRLTKTSAVIPPDTSDKVNYLQDL